MSAAPPTEVKKKQKVRRYTFRGHEEEEIYELPQNQLVELFRARIRRRFKRYALFRTFPCFASFSNS
jgi:hypothetical protein